jgi:DNA-binding transcriptional ArsR family regulator
VATSPGSPAQVFAALADPVRLELVTQLAEGDATVGELAASHPISVQAVSKHLKVLEGAGVVRRDGLGRRAPVQLNAEVFELMDRWVERYRQRCEARYQRLDTVLASMPTAAIRDGRAGRAT